MFKLSFEGNYVIKNFRKHKEGLQLLLPFGKKIHLVFRKCEISRIDIISN